jgi:hypothetical protein
VIYLITFAVAATRTAAQPGLWMVHTMCLERRFWTRIWHVPRSRSKAWTSLRIIWTVCAAMPYEAITRIDWWGRRFRQGAA